jgi:hypothetical protein
MEVLRDLTFSAKGNERLLQWPCGLGHELSEAAEVQQNGAVEQLMIKYNLNDQLKKDEIGRARTKHEKKEESL